MKHSMVTLVAQKFAELIQQFIAVQDIAVASRGTYRSALTQFFLWLEEHPERLEVMSRETILAYKDALDIKGLRPFTRANYLVVVRKFFEWAESMKLFPNIAKGIKGARRGLKSHQKDSLTIEHIQKLLTIIDRSTLQGMRDFALINLLLRTGLRLIEISRADIVDLQWEDDQAVLWVRGKGKDGKDDFVVLLEDTLAPLRSYLKQRKVISTKDPLFASLSDRNYGKRITTFSFSRLIKTYLRKSGINSRRVTAHSLRHTFGVLAIKAGASLHEVQLAMRHSAPTTTEIYLGDIERMKRLEAAPERMINELLTKMGIL